MTAQPAPTGADGKLHGRSAWTTYGYPTDTGKTAGFTRSYRRHTTGLATGGEAGVNDAARAVNFGVLAIQKRLNAAGWKLTLDGILGPVTEKAIIAFQTQLHLDADGIVGRQTMKALLDPVLGPATSKYVIPDKLIQGIIEKESSRDPGAVGWNTPDDTGLVQINRGAHKTVTEEEAFDPTYAINFAGEDLRSQHDRYVSTTSWASYHNERLSWDCAVASHNSPAWAGKWAATGVAPNSLISEYVRLVRQYGAAW